MLTRFVRIQLIIFTIASIVGITAMVLVYLQAPTLLGIGRMTVKVELPRTGGLYRFSNVTYRGVQIGKVTDVRATRAGAEATLSLATSPKVPADLQASVLSVSAVGEQYVDLLPRTDSGPYLRDGSVIPMKDTTVPQKVGPMLDQISALLGSIPKERLSKLLDESFKGLNGSSDDLAALFESSSTVTADLDKVAKALADKPSLKLTVTGSCDPDKEHDDYLKATLEARLQKEKARERARDGQVPAVAAGAAPAPEVFSAAERERLLKAVYKQTDIPDKPRNLVGMAKDISGPEMETLLKTVIPVSDDLMRELALQRGLAVRDGLVAKGLPSERLFVGAPKPRAAYEAFTDSVPGAELALKND